MVLAGFAAAVSDRRDSLRQAIEKTDEEVKQIQKVPHMLFVALPCPIAVVKKVSGGV